MFGYGAQSAYCASKGALIPFAKSLALAWAEDGINVNVVLPGAINTPFTKVRCLTALLADALHPDKNRGKACSIGIGETALRTWSHSSS
jgi:NAD(P)-dependent dehydrogenase (short-subunit alcohol dehydrogenase family)